MLDLYSPANSGREMCFTTLNKTLNIRNIINKDTENITKQR